MISQRSSSEPLSETWRRALIRAVTGSVVLVLGGLALVGILGKAETVDLSSLRLNPSVLALGLLVTALSAAPPSGFRWRALLVEADDRNVSGWVLSAASAVNVLLGLVISGPPAELAAAGVVHRRYGIPVGRLLAAALQARLLGLVTALFLTFSAWTLQPIQIEADQRRLLILGMLATLLPLAALTFPIAAPNLCRRVLAGLKKWLVPRLTGRLPGWIDRLLGVAGDFLEACGDLGALPSGRLVKAFAWSVSGYAAGALGAWWIAEGLGLSANLGAIFFVYNAMSLVAVALFFLPAGYAGHDIMFCVLLDAVAGLSFAEALVVTVFVRLGGTAGLVGAGLGVGAALTAPTAAGDEPGMPPTTESADSVESNNAP